LAVLGLLIGGCGGSSNNGGSSNTADYKACKAMIKADMAQSLSAVKSGRLPQNLPTAGAASCSHLSKDDLTRLMHEVANELKSSPPTAASSPATVASGLHFPAQLFGLSKDTSSDARGFTRQFTSALATHRDIVRRPQGAVYGTVSSNQPFILVSGFSLSSAATPSAESDPASDKSYAESIPRWINSTSVQSFPAGPHGGALYCGHLTLDSVSSFICGWAEKVRGGMVVYGAGSASSLSDAASKTNQVRAAIEP